MASLFGGDSDSMGFTKLVESYCAPAILEFWAEMVRPEGDS
jgi:hypothetical protein